MSSIELLRECLGILKPCAEITTYRSHGHFGAYLEFRDPLKREKPVIAQIGFTGAESGDRDEFMDEVEQQIENQRLRAELLRDSYIKE